MSIRLGNKIGEGGCSEIYELDDSGKIIKLAKPNTDNEAMRNEFHNNLIAWENGLPVARPFELLEIDGRSGIVFERIYGETLMERFLKKVLEPTTGIQETGDNDIRLTARILYEIHSTSNVSLPSSQRNMMKYNINCVGYLTLPEKEEVIAILDNLPVKQLPCHGDPNPGNIFIRNDGKAVVIDWMCASMGNPEADLAEYIIMIRFGIVPAHLPGRVSEYFDSIRESIIEEFMDEYQKLSGIAYSEVSPWIIPAAARKLSADAISEEEKKVLAGVIRRGLGERNQ